MPHRLCAILLLYLCASSALAAGVEVSDAWARATPPGAANGAVFFTLRNSGGQDDRLRQAATPVAKVAELHSHLMEAGVARMRQVPEIVVPAHGSAVLKPGGMHVMLIGLRQPLKEGESIDLVLNFEQAGERKLRVPVRRGQLVGH
jgi:periplasmic copper chaperone A